MKSYFLSYARADQAIARRFADDLIAAGVPVWVDQYEVKPSQAWDRAVEAAVRGCDGMIVILSPRSVESANVADEVSVAIETGKDIIPVLIENCTVPLRLTRMQFIDGTQDYDDAFRRCLAATDGGSAAFRPVEAVRARQPLSEEMLQLAERRLTAFMGPISPRLVRAAAARVDTKADLYRELAKSIPAGAERKSFMAGVADPAPLSFGADPEPVPPSGGRADIPPGELQAISNALLRHLGPIAPRLVSREQVTAQSRRDLCLRLGERIAAERDRAAFLKDVGLG